MSALKLAERVRTGIELGESHFREFKSAFQGPERGKSRDLKTLCRDIGETLVAFANADGGELYIGVEDDGTMTGVPHNESQISAMLEAPRNYVHEKTPLAGPNMARVLVNDRTVLYFQAAKSTSQVHLTADGRCLQRFDRENRPVPAEDIQYNRQEQLSREYDRQFVDGATMPNVDLLLVDGISKHIAGGQSPETFLQYMDLAEYGVDGFRLRRAALLLFARDITRWHPRCEVRILRVTGKELGVGEKYNVSPRDDHTVRGNVLQIIDTAWDTLKPYLARTSFVESIFKETLMFPEDACREALVNAVAHRDYSIEGKGIEILIYDDRLEIRSPGGILSSISIEDLRSGKRAHQSRNVFIARVLRELGYMREMGEGMLRIFSTMRESDLVPPELEADPTAFDIIFHYRSVFSPRDQDWLKAYASYNLSRAEQRAILLGRDGHLLSTNEITRALGIVDTDEFRQLVEVLRRKGILYTALTRPEVGRAFQSAGSKREIGRFSIRPPDQTEQYRRELVESCRLLSERSRFTPNDLRKITNQLSPSSPYRENLTVSLKLLGLVDERLRPLPMLVATWQEPSASHAPRQLAKQETRVEVAPVAPRRLVGTVTRLKTVEGYGFIRTRDRDFFFHVTDLADPSAWDGLTEGGSVSFDPSLQQTAGKAPRAHRVEVRQSAENR